MTVSFNRLLRAVAAPMLALAFVLLTMLGQTQMAYAATLSTDVSGATVVANGTLVIDGGTAGGNASIFVTLQDAEEDAVIQVSGLPAGMTYSNGVISVQPAKKITVSGVTVTGGGVTKRLSDLLGYVTVFVDSDVPRIALEFSPSSGNGEVTNGSVSGKVRLYDSSLILYGYSAAGDFVVTATRAGYPTDTLSVTPSQSPGYSSTADGCAGFDWNIQAGGSAYKFARFQTIYTSGSTVVYGFASAFVDPFGRKAADRRFIADQTAPTYTVTKDSGALSGTVVGPYYVVTGASPLRLVTIAFVDEGAGVTSNGIAVSGTSATYLLEGNSVVFQLEAGKPFQVGSTSISATDGAGNKSGTVKLADQFSNSDTILLDAAAPVIGIGNLSGFFREAKSTTLSFSDDTFDLLKSYYDMGQVVGKVTKDGKDLQNLTLRDFVNGATLNFADDGSYTVSAQVKDAAGRSSNAISLSFAIDTKPPVVNLVSYPGQADETADDLYGEDTIASVGEDDGIIVSRVVISVKDDHFDASSGGSIVINGKRYPASWTNAGGVWYGAVEITEQGTFTIESATATDLAGNTTTVALNTTFIIEDNRRPVIRFIGVEDQAALSGEVIPGVRITDTNLVPEKTEIHLVSLTTGKEVAYTYTGSASESLVTRTYAAFPEDLEVDGIYHFTVRAEDEKGNTAYRSILFSVNRFGSTYLFDDQTEALRGAYLTRPGKVSFIEINPSGFEEGAISIVVTVDGVPRVLREGVDFLLENVADSAWPAVRYTFIANPFTTDSYYQIVARSVDRANNLNQNIMWTRGLDHSHAAEITFALDTTAPTARIMESDLQRCFLGDTRTVTLLLEDNMELAEVTVLLDGVELELPEWEPGAAATLSLTIPAADHLQTLEVWVADAAGNEGSCMVEGIFVTNDAMEYWKSSTRLQALTIIAGVTAMALLALAVWFAIWRGKRRKEAREGLEG